MGQMYDAVKIAAKGIRIISEGEILESNPDFSEAQKRLNTARRIYSLGFGYHKDNMRRLRAPFGSTNMNIEGSCFGMTDAEAQHLRNLYRHFVPYHGTCIDFLRNSHTFQVD
jgi:hypothetical protein